MSKRCVQPAFVIFLLYGIVKGFKVERNGEVICQCFTLLYIWKLIFRFSLFKHLIINNYILAFIQIICYYVFIKEIHQIINVTFDFIAIIIELLSTISGTKMVPYKKLFEQNVTRILGHVWQILGENFHYIFWRRVIIPFCHYLIVAEFSSELFEEAIFNLCAEELVINTTPHFEPFL